LAVRRFSGMSISENGRYSRRIVAWRACIRWNAVALAAPFEFSPSGTSPGVEGICQRLAGMER
jgi:hypothetical protein